MMKKVYLLLIFSFISLITFGQNMVEISVGGKCEMCTDRIESAAGQVIGIMSVKYILKDQKLKVEIQPGIFSLTELHEKLASVGHDTDQMKAEDSVYNALPECCHYRKSPSSLSSTSIIVGGKCEMCTDRIEEIAVNISGIKSANYNLSTQRLSISFSDKDFSVSELHKKLAKAGHDTNLVKADDKDYENLPLCCNYRDNKQATTLNENISFIISVGGECDMCKLRIETAALNTIGVKTAEYSLEDHFLKVKTGGLFLIEELHKNIAAVGHDTDQLSADKTVYDNLPACCLYRPEVETEEGLVKGTVFMREPEDGKSPLIGANIYWLKNTQATTTDMNGTFSLRLPAEKSALVISYIGFRNDTLNIEKGGNLEILLTPDAMLAEVEIKRRRRTTEVSYVSPIKILKVSKKELTKAACCSLAESFQTTPAIDESFTDAVTGTRTIEMLGLASPYIQITRENIPDIRGLSIISGLEHTPGPWIESIQLNQGSGSVVNGYESITGQINVELFNPYSEEKLYFNAYANEGGRLEANITVNQEVSDYVSTALLFHSSTRKQKHDRNNDGFLDMPLSAQFLLINRWKYNTKNGWTGQAGVKIIDGKSESGQTSAFTENNSSAWYSKINNRRYDFWAKSGRLFNENRSSIGLQFSASIHDLESSFGNRDYNGDQESIYGNFIYQTLIGESGSNIKLGGTFSKDNFKEDVSNTSYLRDEVVSGVFGEYTFLKEEIISVVAGMRYDHHNSFGGFFTPRAHVRYAPVESTVFRLSAGRGQKTANVFAENIGGFASSRVIKIEGNDNSTPYGLQPEVAWNYGFNIQHEFKLGENEGSVGVDFYRTEFENQVVVDYDSDAQSLSLYNLDGKSYSNSIQMMVVYEMVKNLDFRVAYRLNDVKTDYKIGRLQKPLIARNRAFANIAYETEGGWKMDYTINRIGSKRIPITSVNNITESPAFFLSNAQVSKLWSNKFEVYLGAENLFNFQQENPILSSESPFSDTFDASLVWGPIFGRMIYAGLRYKIFN